MNYGPTKPVESPDFDQLATPTHLIGYAEKILLDLEKVARIYHGVNARIFTLDEAGTRCSACTDSFTGKVVLSNCATCGGTGFISGYTYQGKFKVLPQFSAKSKTSTQMGDSEGNRRRDLFIVLRGPQLQDQDLIVTEETKRVYKIVDDEPQITAIGGKIILQTVGCAPLTKGAPEYSVVTW
jgi:DnaJ-class molecular chaperone